MCIELLERLAPSGSGFIQLHASTLSPIALLSDSAQILDSRYERSDGCGGFPLPRGDRRASVRLGVEVRLVEREGGGRRESGRRLVPCPCVERRRSLSVLGPTCFPPLNPNYPVHSATANGSDHFCQSRHSNN